MVTFDVWYVYVKFICIRFIENYSRWTGGLNTHLLAVEPVLIPKQRTVCTRMSLQMSLVEERSGCAIGTLDTPQQFFSCYVLMSLEEHRVILWWNVYSSFPYNPRLCYHDFKGVAYRCKLQSNINTDLHTGMLNALMPQQKFVMVSMIVAHVTHKLCIAVAHLMSP